MTTETFWMAGGLFELSYNISSSTTTPHEIESYAKTTGDGTQVWDGIAPIKATVTVNPGINLGSTAPGTAGLSTGNGPWPSGSSITIINGGHIFGKGGDGGPNQAAGQPGGNAIEINGAVPVTIQNNATISGGGGAGGGGQPASGTNPPGPPPGELQGPNPGNPWSATGGVGGGGAGYQPGDPGGSTSGGGGAGYRAGAGGGLGAAGQPGSGGSAGSAGYYIKQNSNPVTWQANGTRNGSAQP